MSAQFACLEGPEGPDEQEWHKAWAELIARTGSSEGWQYMGSDSTCGSWLHHFRSRQAAESAACVEEYEAARQQVAASDDWTPEHAQPVA